MNNRESICRRAVKLLRKNQVVNIGIGMPTEMIPLIPEELDIWIMSENGVIGLGMDEDATWDRDLIDAGGTKVPIKKGGACFDIPTSMGLMRGGHIDAAILGGYEVDQEGNLANWTVPGKTASGMGGAMDIATGAKSLIILMEHCDRNGNPKILKKCRLPLTCAHCVDYIVTEKCILHRTDVGLLVEEIASGYTAEDIINSTEADLVIV